MKDAGTGEVSIINEEAFLVTQWLERGVFLALEHEYITSMVFAIFTKDPKSKADILLETYEFRITYPSQDHHFPQINDVDLTSKDAVKNQAVKLIRSLTEFTATLDNLPEERWITMELKVSHFLFLCSSVKLIDFFSLGSTMTKLRLSINLNSFVHQHKESPIIALFH